MVAMVLNGNALSKLQNNAAANKGRMGMGFVGQC